MILSAKKTHGIHMDKGSRIYTIIVYSLVTLLTLIITYPLYFCIIASFSDPDAVAMGDTIFWFKGFTFEAYTSILGEKSILTGYRNSMLYMLLGTSYNMLLTIPTAYVLSKKDLPGHKGILWFFFITMYFSGGLIPTYIWYKDIGLVDNPLVMIIPGAINTQFLLITRTFLQGIPDELEEAAVIDGANDWQIMTHVFLPLSPTILATVGTFYAVSIWNQYLIPQIYLKTDAIKTIQQVLKSVVITDGASGTTFRNVVVGNVTLNQQNLKSAAIFITMLPIICVYPFVQKYFKKGILLGSVKG